MSPVLHVEGCRTLLGSDVVGRCRTGFPSLVVFVAVHLVYVVYDIYLCFEECVLSEGQEVSSGA
jgi:hypothetical protein